MTPDLDDLLTASAPTLAEVDDLAPVLEDLVRDARPRRSRRRAGRRTVLIGTTTAGVVIAGSAAAAALAIGGWTSPWAQDPDGALEFTLPSGTECEYRIGNLTSTSPERTNDLRAWLDDHTLAELVDVDAEISALRADDQTWVKDDGTEVRVGYGTAYYDADEEYAAAVNRAIGTAVVRQAEKVGALKIGGSLGLEGEIHCENGIDPTIPAWQR